MNNQAQGFNRPESLIGEHEAAALLDLKVGTLRNDRVTRRIGIPFVKMSSAVRYRPSDLIAFIERHVVNAEREAA